jgi:uncharacterized membrane protein YwaF
MKHRRSILKTIVAPIVVIVAFIPTLAIAIREVLAGRGAATYSNVYELPIHYTSVLIIVAVLLLVIAVAYVARIVYFWRFRHIGTSKIRKTDACDSKVGTGHE